MLLLCGPSFRAAMAQCMHKPKEKNARTARPCDCWPSGQHNEKPGSTCMALYAAGMWLMTERASWKRCTGRGGHAPPGCAARRWPALETKEPPHALTTMVCAQCAPASAAGQNAHSHTACDQLSTPGSVFSAPVCMCQHNGRATPAWYKTIGRTEHAHTPGGAVATNAVAAAASAAGFGT